MPRNSVNEERTNASQTTRRQQGKENRVAERPNGNEKIRYRIAVLDYRTKEVKVFGREYSKTQDVEAELTREGILHDDTEYMTTVVGENGLKVTIE